MDRNKSTARKWRRLKLNSNFFAWVNIFMELNDCDEIPLCEILYFVRVTGLQAE
jgi:hypothetical protein